MRALRVSFLEEERTSQTYYEILEIQPDATQSEIRESYLKIRAAYGKDSLALYSLMSPSETAEILRRIEEAYLILSHPEKRKDYDRKYGHSIGEGFRAEVVSIDRTPPMETSSDLLNAPRTDFSSNRMPERPPSAFDLRPATIPTSSMKDSPELAAIQTEIQNETEWSGAFLRRVRETRGVSLEEMSEATRISKTYLTALEEENYPKLPAAVYVRGFLVQVARNLRIDPEKVTKPYLARFTGQREES